MDSIAEKFVEYAQTDSDGYSDDIKIETFYKDQSIDIGSCTNGHAWSADRGKGLGSEYYLIKTYERGVIKTREQRQGDNNASGLGSLISIKLDGLKKKDKT